MPRRVAFRFAVIAAVLLIGPFPLGVLPHTDGLATLANAPWDGAVGWTAEHVLGIPAPGMDAGGSGDSTWAWIQLLLLLVFAVAGTAIWSILDRRRRAYPRLAALAEPVVRYWLAFTMLSYGFAKVVNVQFPVPDGMRLEERLGDMSPMGLMWAFMGHSQPYAIFGGLVEVIAGALLLWRRTRTLGLLATAAVMTNVAMMNLCYDVPVKLFSLTLLAVSLALVSPQLRRLIAAATGSAVPELPPRLRESPRLERARLAIKAILIASMAYNLYAQRADFAAYFAPRTALDGTWAVDRFVANGVERPALATDDGRWAKLVVAGGAKTGQVTRGLVLSSSGAPAFYMAFVDADAHTLVLSPKGGRFTYARTGDRLVLDAPGWHVELHLQPPGLLESRGFHWIQDGVLNR